MCMPSQDECHAAAQPLRCKQTAVRRNLRIWKEAKRSVLTGLAVAAVLLAILAAYINMMPPFPEGHWEVLKRFPPMSIAQLTAQRDVVQAYAAQHLAAILVAYVLLYVLMQTFAIPGTLSLSLLAGALFGAYRGLLLVAAVSTLGSCACFALSRLIGKALAHAIWPERLQSFAEEVEKRRGDMLNYVIFLRVTPILPNIFINIASPVVNVPIGPFALGTLLGCLPNNLLAVNAGSKLGSLQSLADLYDVRILLVGCGVGLMAVLPVTWKHVTSGRQAPATPVAADALKKD